MWKLLLALFVALVHGNDEFKGDKVFRIIPRTNREVKRLSQWIEIQGSEFDVWKEPSQPHVNVDVHVKASDVDKTKKMLESNKIEYSIMIADLGYLLKEEAKSNQRNAFAFGFDYTRYNQYIEIQSELRNLGNKYTSASTFTVGRSYEGQQILGIKISTGGLKPAIWIDGGIHAREWISPATVMYFIKELLTSNNPSATQALNKYDFYLLPVFNVDGYKYTFNGGRARMWRKTRSGNGWCKGVDPNRNWSYKWGGAGTSSNPCSDIYCGPRAFSEIEVRNVANYLKQIRNLKSYWNVHAYSQLVLTPWSYTKSLPEDYGEIKRVADVFVNVVSQQYGTYYRAGPPSRILYAVGGGSIDWTYADLGVRYSYALELRDQGRYGFVLPASQITPSGIETSEALLAAINAMQ